MALKFKTDFLNCADAVCRKYGYYIGAVDKYGEIASVSIRILDGQDYMPAIYQEGLGEAKNGFHAQTTSYGALRETEYKKFLDACNRAFDLVHFLNKQDFSVVCDGDWYYEKE